MLLVGVIRMDLDKFTPGGAQTRSKMHEVFGWYPFPKTLRCAKGSIAYDDDARPYLDWMASLASVCLGYDHPEVTEEVQRYIREGAVSLSLPTLLEYRVAELLCDTLKWPEQVRFVKTGSEATAAAMQIARAATRRKKVISIGYHGWHEAHLPSENLIDVPWGREEALDRAMSGDVAAVILETMRDHRKTHDGYTDKTYAFRVKSYCQEYGALLIMDEMVTGFRWAIGGATEYLGITPDLACYGKAMANGYPLAAVVGPRRLMKYAHDVSSTFGGEGVGLAAAKATIEIYRREPVIDRLWQIGRNLMAGVPQLTGYPVHPHFTGSAGWTDSDSVIPLVQYAAKEGVLMHPSGLNPMYCHSDADVDRTIRVLNAAVAHASVDGIRT